MIGKILVIGLVGCLVLFVLTFPITVMVKDIKGDTFCEKIFPSKLDNNYNFPYATAWGDKRGIEKGYIKCCRTFYNKSHEQDEECMIFNKE